MNDDNPYFDQRIANEAQAAEQCMKLGAVIFKPQGQTTIGFSAPPAPVDAQKLARQVKFSRRTS